MSDPGHRAWILAPLADLALLKTGPFGSALHKSDYVEGGTPLVNPMHIVSGRIVPTDSARVDLQVLQRLSEFKLMRGDVILGRRGEMGRCAVVGEAEDGWLCGTGSLIVRPLGALDARYLQRFLSSPDVVGRLEGASVGSTMVNLNQSILRGLSVPVAPLAEQKRIADKLDTLFACVDACREHLDRVPAILKRLRQSVLAAATSGELTREWREDTERSSRGTLPPTWRESTIKEVGRLQLGRQRSPKYHSGANMRPYLRVQNVFEDRLDLSDVMTMAFPGEDAERYELRVGDILLNEGQSPQFLGRPAMYKGELPGACFTNTLIRFQASEQVLPAFALLVFRHQMHAGRYASEGTITTNIAHLGVGRFGEIEFPLPPLGEQSEIVRRADVVLALVDRLGNRLEGVRACLGRLQPSMLAKAFRGELVPQDANDQSIDEMLAQIRSRHGSPADIGKRERGNSGSARLQRKMESHAYP